MDRDVTTSSIVSAWISRASRLALVAAAGIGLAACQDSGDSLRNARAYRPIPDDVVALMQQKDTDSHAPILIRAYKKEAEFEIWKMNAKGDYVHLKTYPMCRWSGQLGPKVKEGDRQVPEGFYTITPGQMNPNSAYYLSFNVGYPNAYDRAHNYTGGAIMVHGDCSSAGCFSMTDQQIAEIYAIAREAFGGGQRAIQFQSMPFRMTAENLAKFRFDPNIKFWKSIKEGSDEFDVTKHETKVAVCSGKYVFGETLDGHVDATAACPSMKPDAELNSLVAEKERDDDAKVAELVAKGVKPVRVVYEDGGQNPNFTNHSLPTSRPDAIAAGPVEIPIDAKGKPLPESVQVASAAPSKPETKSQAVKTTAKVETPAANSTQVAAAPAPAPEAKPAEEQAFFQKWLGAKPPAAPAAAVDPPIVSVDPAPSDVPRPPKRQAQSHPVKPQASLATPPVVVGSRAVIPEKYSAYAPADR